MVRTDHLNVRLVSISEERAMNKADRQLERGDFTWGKREIVTLSGGVEAPTHQGIESYIHHQSLNAKVRGVSYKHANNPSTLIMHIGIAKFSALKVNE
jgi:hypothetical protein